MPTEILVFDTWILYSSSLANSFSHSSSSAVAVATSILASVVANPGSDVNSQPNRLWATHREYQEYLVPTPAPDLTFHVQAITDGLQRLTVQSDTPSAEDLANRPTQSQPPANVLPATQATSDHPSFTSDPEAMVTLRNRERNSRTKKAHRIFDKIDKDAQICLHKLAGVASPAELTILESEAKHLRPAFEAVTREVPSLDERRKVIGQRLFLIEAGLEQLRLLHPRSNDEPLEYNSNHHFDRAIDLYSPVAQMTMFIAVICTVMIGVSRDMGNLILRLFSLTLRWAFRDRDGNLDATRSSIMDQIPSTVETVLSKFNLDGKTTIYATCPECHCTYPPIFKPGSSIPHYPERCTNRPYPGAEECDSFLLDSQSPSDNTSPRPLKPYVVYDFHDYLASLLSRTDLEDIMDRSCDELMETINKKELAPSYVTDVFQGEYIRTFEGPIKGQLFVDQPGTEGRYLFAINVDFFSTEGMTIRGATASSGIISLSCLNLPLEMRNNNENIYLASVIPGPNEPRLTELNHYVRPVVDQFVESWERGVRYTRTANHLTGRCTRSAIAIAVCDLPGGHKLSQTANHSSHFYCTRCTCFHKSTLGRTDFKNWQLRDCNVLREHAMEWKNAATRKEQEHLFSAHGVRWSELWRLPYWDPPRMLVVDCMHCLLEGLCQYHFREVLKLTSASATANAPQPNAFDYQFQQPDTNSGLAENVVKQVSQIHNLLVAPLSVAEPDLEAAFLALTHKLHRKNKDAIVYVAKSLNLSHSHPRATKLQWAEELCTWRRKFPTSVPTEFAPKLVTVDVMDRIRAVVKETSTPSWLPSVPYNFGDAAAGTLKADEWRTMATVYLPIALISVWSTGTSHPLPSASAATKKVLDHTMALVSAVSLACRRTMTQFRMDAYRDHLTFWYSNLCQLHPESSYRVNAHMAFHVYDFLRLFGPVRSWWCFPFERLIGILQRLPHNHKHGQIEMTMTLSFLKVTKLKQWLQRPDCPAFLRECKVVFDKAFGKSDVQSSPADSAFVVVPSNLRHLIKGPRVALRAYHIVNKLTYSRSSTHLGNSLVMFYPKGNRSKRPVPGSIEHIIVYPTNKVLYTIRRQVEAQIGTADPYAEYPHFPAQLYCNQLSDDLEVIQPDWVMSHYVRWNFSKDHCVVLNLSRVMATISNPNIVMKTTASAWSAIPLINRKATDTMKEGLVAPGRKKRGRTDDDTVDSRQAECEEKSQAKLAKTDDPSKGKNKE
ncbi:hypothetical protein CVT25_009725 [Psilocybe cyanescens]|uniref:DUF4218 domain-containing protein n=1 Tax=Psilocybe cyanescens TaxID=93625 RepID=A0A409XGP6_PSICY|nr:hypothetical protein CVT25_009725 [Psilocybe cyanescens]